MFLYSNVLSNFAVIIFEIIARNFNFYNTDAFFFTTDLTLDNFLVVLKLHFNRFMLPLNTH